jgi:hypothetical protein
MNFTNIPGKWRCPIPARARFPEGPTGDGLLAAMCLVILSGATKSDLTGGGRDDEAIWDSHRLHICTIPKRESEKGGVPGPS